MTTYRVYLFTRGNGATSNLTFVYSFIQSTALFALLKAMRFTLTKVKSKLTFVKCFALCSELTNSCTKYLNLPVTVEANP